jgi:hypothetical protein
MDDMMPHMSEGEKELMHLLYGGKDEAQESFNKRDDKRFTERCVSDPVMRIKKSKLDKLEEAEGHLAEVYRKAKDDLNNIRKEQRMLYNEYADRRTEIRQELNRSYGEEE